VNFLDTRTFCPLIPEYGMMSLVVSFEMGCPNNFHAALHMAAASGPAMEERDQSQATKDKRGDRGDFPLPAERLQDSRFWFAP